MEPQCKAFIDSVKQQLTGEDIAIHIGACLNCGNCGQACAWYLGTNDRRYHPLYRASVVRDVYHDHLSPVARVAHALGVGGGIQLEDLRQRMGALWSCTACGRCTLACPAGISTRRLIQIGRTAYSVSGLADEDATLRTIADKTRHMRHSYGLTREQIFGRAAMFLRYSNTDMPMDIEGAEYLVICPSSGNTMVPELATTTLMQVLNAANLSYTVSSTIIDTGTEISHINRDPELSRQLLLEWEAEAERLNAKKIVVMECGCDTHTMYHEASEELGRPFRVPMISVDSILDDLITSGELPVEPLDVSMTFHDPCYVSRLTGVGERFYRLMPQLVRDFRPMIPNRHFNYCCNGGAGGLRLAANREARRRASVIKAKQIKATGTELVATPCVVCYLTLNDLMCAYGITVPGQRGARMFFEVVQAALTRSLKRSGELDRVRRPLLLRGKEDDAEYMAKHSALAMLEDWLLDPQFFHVLKWIVRDGVIKEYGRRHPGFVKLLDEYLALLSTAAQRRAETKTTPRPPIEVVGC